MKPENAENLSKMARSRNIYLVYVDSNDEYHRFPLAVFTVKHEAITYIERTFSSKGQEAIKLYSMPDGRGEHPTELEIE